MKEGLLVGLLALCCLAPALASLGLFAWFAASGYAMLAGLALVGAVIALLAWRRRVGTTSCRDSRTTPSENAFP